MAIIKSLPATKSLSSQLKYLEKEGKTIDELKEGINCTTDNVEREFNIIKNLYNKPGGKQYYHFTQAFSPEDNITPEKAHRLGKEWIENNIKDHQVYMVTHIDKNHIHNHFVINSVNMENGLKLQINPYKLMEMKKDSNMLCDREKLSKINLEPNKGISKTDSEYRLEKKGIITWKDELRQCIDFAKNQTSNIEELKEYLKEHFSIEVRETKNSISYKHPEQNKSVRGNKLGGSYTKEGLLNEFDGKTRSNEERSGRTEGTQQVTRAEHEGKNGVREYTSEGKFGEINERIRDIEQSIKGNSNGEPQGDGREAPGSDWQQPGIEKAVGQVLQDISRRVRERDRDFER